MSNAKQLLEAANARAIDADFNPVLPAKPIVEYEQYVDDDGYIWDDEGNKGGYVGKEYAGQTFGLHDAPRVIRGGDDYGPKKDIGPPKWQSQRVKDQIRAINAALKKKPDKFLSSVGHQIYMWGDRSLKVPSEKQKAAVVRALERLGMYDEAKLFGGKGKPPDKPMEPSEKATEPKSASQASHSTSAKTVVFADDKERVSILDTAISKRPNDFLQSIRSQLQAGRKLSDKQLSAVRHNLYKLGMRPEADKFRV